MWSPFRRNTQAPATPPRPALQFPLHRNDRFAPFFIVGSGRSGTTLMRRMVQANGQVHIPPEITVMGPVIHLFRQYNAMQWSELVHLIFARFEFHPESDVFNVSLRPLVQQLVKVPPESRSLAMLLDRFYRYHGEQTAGPCDRWGDKTPLNSFYLTEIDSIFPDARYVHMLRDGVDVVHSMLQQAHRYTVASASARWKDAVHAVQTFAQTSPQRCLEIRYESLVREPSAVARRVCDFLDVAFDPRMIETDPDVKGLDDVRHLDYHANAFKPIVADGIGKGRRTLSESQRRHVQELIGTNLERLGYESAV